MRIKNIFIMIFRKTNFRRKNMISKIKWKNHSVLGNLELDFTKDNGEIYNTIILA